MSYPYAAPQVITCPYCNTAMQCPAHMAGQIVACPNCRNQLQMPVAGLPEPIPIEPPKPSDDFAISNISTRPSSSANYRHSAGRVRSSGMNPVLAAFLSLILVGLPQMCMGQAIKGIVMLLVAIIAGALTGCIACLVIWPVALIDAVCIANKLQSGQAVGEWEFF